MKTVRYFSKQVDPVEYRRGFGVSGVVVCLLNAIRLFLERTIVLMILDIEAKAVGMPRKERKELRKQAIAESMLRSQLTDKIRPAGTVLERIPTLWDVMRSERYRASRKNTDLDAGLERPIPLEEGLATTFSRYARRSDRSARYVPGRVHISYDAHDKKEVPVDRGR